jgi:CRP-like cAMP-binding protein
MIQITSPLQEYLKVDVSVNAGVSREIRLATLGSGTAFGEASMLNERRRAADMTAARDRDAWR